MASSFAELAASNDGDVSAGIGSTINDPSDPMVNLGKTQIDAGDDYQFVNGRPKGYEYQMRTAKLSEAVLEPYKLRDPNEIRNLQEKLFRGGFYGNAKRSQVQWGAVDDLTGSAYETALKRTATFNQAGRNDLSVDDVINDGVAHPTEQANVYSFTPAEEIAAVIKKVSPQVLGRNVDDNVINTLINTYHSFEKQKQDEGSSAAPNQAWLEDQIKQLNPEAAQAYQTAGNIGSFLKLVDGQGMFSAYHQ